MIFEAIEFAARAHSGQYRKNTKIPYILHPLQVAEILIENSSPEPVVVASILHDTIEDSHITPADIKSQFGDEVAHLVKCVTEPEKKLPWEYRKQHTINAIPGLPAEAITILLADKLHNLKSIRMELSKEGESAWQRFNRPKEKQKWYFLSLLNEIKKREDTEQYTGLFRQFEQETEHLFKD